MPPSGSPVVIDWSGMEVLFRALGEAGFQVVGPTLHQGAIVLDKLSSADDLPVGVGETQEAGTYRLRERGDRAAFGYAVGPQSWRRFLSPPRELLWRARRSAAGFDVDASAKAEPGDAQERYAFIGVRSCDLHAIGIQDRVFAKGAVADPRYASRRADAFIVAVNCTEPGGTCFCTSMGTGPRATAGFDLALTELMEGGHRFVVEEGSDSGAEMLAALPRREADARDTAEAEELVQAAGSRMGRTLETKGLPELMATTLEHPHWDVVAERCLSCANCTLVCPTCFCSTVEDTADLAGDNAERWRRWDSCFTADFSYIHGGSVRSSIRSRYRQWLTHKVGTWHDQFGTSGCVGCGRCITWCPVGIDLTQEVAALRVGATAGGEEEASHEGTTRGTR